MDDINVTEDDTCSQDSADRILTAIGELKKEINEIQSGILERRSELSELSRKLEGITTIPVVAKKRANEQAGHGLTEQDFALCSGMNEAKFTECGNYCSTICEDDEIEASPPNCFSIWEDSSSAGSLCAFELIEKLLDNAVYGDIKFQLNRKNGGIHVPSETSETAILLDDRVLLPNRSLPVFVSKPIFIEMEVQSNRSLPELRVTGEAMDRGDLMDAPSVVNPTQRRIWDHGEVCAETPVISKSCEEVQGVEATKPLCCADIGDVQRDSE